MWPERFARQHGPLRSVVERVLREFLRCELVEHGFARLWCGERRRSVLVAFYRPTVIVFRSRASAEELPTVSRIGSFSTTKACFASSQ